MPVIFKKVDDNTTAITNFASDTAKECMIDTEDAQRIKEFSSCWFYHKDREYVFTTKKINNKQCTIELHRLINNTPEGLHTDHIDHDKLNNRKSNLRSVTAEQNMRNMKTNKEHLKYKGVYENADGSFRACIQGKTSGSNYATAEDGARAYNIEAKELFGEYACINNVPDPFSTPDRRARTIKPLQYKISYYKQYPKKPWRLFSYYNGKAKHIGYFETQQDAEKAKKTLESAKTI